ncbi:hypothetical protein PybrP1_010007 [[Pythium] brassicae (nom. inval.)]|nr:hypothetical protein PybrP1_010007 [[Pythium] brassicae (nom. inval.)]
MASPERKSTPLLTLLASKAIAPGSFSGAATDITTKPSAAESADDDAQRAQSNMMYAARMKYLDDTDQVQPDPLFMTRKQAQKAAQRHDTSVTLKKLDVVSPQARKANATNAAASAAGLVAWKKANNLRAAGDERSQVWEAKFQAGCHFWQNVETAECRTIPPSNAQHIGVGGTRCSLQREGDDNTNGDEGDDDDPPFPDSFAFLTAPSVQ